MYPDFADIEVADEREMTSYSRGWSDAICCFEEGVEVVHDRGAIASGLNLSSTNAYL